MTKTKKNSKRDPLEGILIEGEEVLWQGKPHASMLEYTREKPSKFSRKEFGIKSLTQSANFSAVSESRYAFCLFSFSIIIAGMTGHLLVLLSVLIGQWLSFSIPRWADLLCFFPTLLILGIVAILYLPAIISSIILYIQKTVTGIVEKPFIKYAITNERIVVITNSWVYDFVNHIVINRVEIEDSQHGALVKLLTTGREHTPIQPFIGLSDFDVNHILEIVRKRSTFAVIIDDKRENQS